MPSAIRHQYPGKKLLIMRNHNSAPGVILENFHPLEAINI